MKRTKQKNYSRYIVFSEIELLFLSICVLLDVSEYIAAILLLPLFGDFLDLAGIFASVLMFGWVGFISIIELVPGADILPIFILTWVIWYITKKRATPIKIA